MVGIEDFLNFFRNKWGKAFLILRILINKWEIFKAKEMFWQDVQFSSYLAIISMNYAYRN